MAQPLFDCYYTFWLPFFIVTLLEIIPSNETVCAGDYATFHCSSGLINSRIFWFLNDSVVNAFPNKYLVSYSVYYTKSGMMSSTLRILGLEEINNSVIMCAADLSHGISNFSLPVLLRGMSTAIFYVFMYINCRAICRFSSWVGGCLEVYYCLGDPYRDH